MNRQILAWSADSSLPLPYDDSDETDADVLSVRAEQERRCEKLREIAVRHPRMSISDVHRIADAELAGAKARK